MTLVDKLFPCCKHNYFKNIFVIELFSIHIVLLFADGLVKTDLGCNGFRGSEITLYGEIPPEIPVEKHEKMQPRTKVKTNGHFTTFMQVSFVVYFFLSVMNSRLMFVSLYVRYIFVISKVIQKVLLAALQL